MKAHMYTKCRQFTEITQITGNLNEDKILIHLDYSKNYKCQHQSEIQNVYFCNKAFSFFTACRYYKQNEKIQKLPIKVTTEQKEKWQRPCLVSTQSSHSIDKINQTISNVHIVNDGCAAQLCSRFVFNFLIIFQKDVSVEWHYNEAHHEKTPMDDIGGTTKNLVHHKVLSGAVVIETEVCQIC